MNFPKLRFFKEREFKRPELLDPEWLRELDELRGRFGHKIIVVSDVRTVNEQAALYDKEVQTEIDRGLRRGTLWPMDGPHVFINDTLVRCADVKVVGVKISPAETKIRFNNAVTSMFLDGTWAHLGFGVETQHFHIDDTPRLKVRRPAFWVDVSR